MIKIAIISSTTSELSMALTCVSNIHVEFIPVNEAHLRNLNEYDAYCVLGGTTSTPLMLPVSLRTKLEIEMKKGKRAFFEYCVSIYDTYSDRTEIAAHKRLAYLGDSYDNLKQYDVLDDQNNKALSYHFKYEDSRPLMVYREFIMAHSNISAPLSNADSIQNWAIWYLKENVLICSFRLCSFNKAMFTPIIKWHSVIKMIFTWLCKTEPILLNLPVPYKLNNSTEPFNPKLKLVIQRATNWFSSADLLIDGGRGGIKEGLSHIISSDGNQSISEVIRADCCGEASLAYYAQYKLSHDTYCLKTFHYLNEFIYEGLQIKGTAFDGMVRWSDMAWTVCYQDDVARAIIPSILFTIYENDNKYISNIERALDFLVKTTTDNGLRSSRTDLLLIYGSDNIELLKTQNIAIACAHYNAYYHAALLMAYKLLDKEEYLTTACKGLEALMAVYPDTVREQSETEELCRLIMPLAWLYYTTGEDKHKEMLYMVTNDLQRFKSFNGAYLEWDTGYKAHCSKKKNTESSLLADNGDPVCDFLYSMNWLPMAFSQAYMITKDKMFLDLWKENALFFASCQIISDNKTLNGCWARGFDPEMREYYGMPHDVGWGPWAVESGWTVGEISGGLGLGLIADELLDFYK